MRTGINALHRNRRGDPGDRPRCSALIPLRVPVRGVSTAAVNDGSGALRGVILLATRADDQDRDDENE